jgi:hypothetical protein
MFWVPLRREIVSKTNFLTRRSGMSVVAGRVGSSGGILGVLPSAIGTRHVHVLSFIGLS